MSLKVIKDDITRLEWIKRSLNVDSVCELPNRELLRARMCDLDHVIESLKEYVYDNAE